MLKEKLQEKTKEELIEGILTYYQWISNRMLKFFLGLYSEIKEGNIKTIDDYITDGYTYCIDSLNVALEDLERALIGDKQNEI